MTRVKLAVALLLAMASALVSLPQAEARGRAVRGGRAVARAVRCPTPGTRIAVQPFEGPNGTAVRAQIARIARGRGFRVMTSLPHYEGTAQYPGLARDHRLSAFVTGDVEERGSRHYVTFLVWNGIDGSVVARWSTAAPPKLLLRAVGKGFWKNLGPAMLGATAPARTTPDQAPPMRIDASDDDDAIAVN